MICSTVLLACSGATGDTRVTLAAIAGRWSSNVNGDVMVVAADGTFRWGRPYSGRFAVVSTGQIVMSLRENGKFIGGLPVTLSEEVDTLRLTPGAGPHMEFHRIAERDSASSDR